MAIVVIGGIKGGSGKTTIATNLAVMVSKTDKKILLVDADEQRSVSDWIDQREALEVETNFTTIQLSGKNIHTQISKLKQDFDEIIIDVGGRDTTSQRSALSIADLVIIPFKPRSLDIWTLGSVKTLLSQMMATNPNLKAMALLNQCDAQGNDHEEAYEVLATCEELSIIRSPIVHRKAFSNAAADGLGVVEMNKIDKKAVAEMKNFYAYVYGMDGVDVETVQNMCEAYRK